MPEFIKFPRTPHLHGQVKYREDLQLSEEETEELLSQPLIIQEKIDGTNIGLSFNQKGNLKAQTRGSYIDFREEQFKKLWVWYSQHRDSLLSILKDDKILFGDWLYAQHSLYYDQLPSYFLAYDLYESKEKKFISQKRLNQLLAGSGISTVPVIFGGLINSREELEKLVQSSCFGPELSEGLYLRVDSENYNQGRYKLVRPGFQQSIEEHWKKQPLVLNKSLDEVERYWSEPSKT